MYNIAFNEITTAQGLGDSAEALSWANTANDTLRIIADIFGKNSNNSNSSNNQQNSSGTTVVGEDPATYSPKQRYNYNDYNNNNSNNDDKKTDWVPWAIAGGAAFLLLFGFMIMSNNKKR